MFARDLACQTLDIQVADVASGRASLRMRVTDRMVNGHGIAHGGYLFLLADAAFAYASNAHGPIALAQNAQITFLRPAFVDDRLLAEAVERTRQGRIGVYDVTVRLADGSIVAEFRGHSVLLTGVPEPHSGRHTTLTATSVDGGSNAQ
jgi:acyl-CoA thioesterase